MTIKSLYISVIISVLCLVQVARAQGVAPVNITVQLVPPYSSRIVDYVSPGNDKLRVIALQRDLTQSSYRFFLRIEVSVNGQVLFRTKSDWQPAPITVAPGTPVILDGTELQQYFDVNHLDFINFNRDRYLTNPNLPEGYTSICVTANDYSRPDVVVSTPYCANYFLTLPEPPLLNYPACGMQLPALSPQQVIFSWVPMSMGNAAAQNTVYELSVYENRDNRNPNDIVQNVAPIYTTRTATNSVVYGAGEPALLTGMNYVWRVQAIDEKGQQAFKNNGFSQPCYFTYTADNSTNWNNARPLVIYAQAMNENNAKIGWQPDNNIKYDQYTVYYRKKGNANNWFNTTLTDTVFFVNNLEESTAYETRVQGIKGGSPGLFSDIAGFTTPKKKPVACKEGPGILATYNGQPYLNAIHNDIVHYGQFELKLNQVQALQPGYYKGTGTVTIPFMLDMELSVSFDNIQIDNSMQVTAGEVNFDTEGVDAWRKHTETINTVIKNLSDGLKQLLNSSVKDEDAQWQQLEDKVKELAEKELPQALKDSLNNALSQMEDARTAYQQAKQAYDNAATAAEKQEAENKMDAAEKKYEDSKEALDAISKEKDKLVKGVAEVIIKALKELSTESKDLYNAEEATKSKKDFTDELYSKQNITGQLTGTVLIGRVTTVTINADEITDEMKQYNTKAGAYLQSVTKGKLSKIATAINTFYKDTATITQFFSDDQALGGSNLLKLIIDAKQNGKTDQELLVLAKKEIVNRIQLIIAKEQ